jgi:hypothetical protein
MEVYQNKFFYTEYVFCKQSLFEKFYILDEFVENNEKAYLLLCTNFYFSRKKRELNKNNSPNILKGNILVFSKESELSRKKYEQTGNKMLISDLVKIMENLLQKRMYIFSNKIHILLQIFDNKILENRLFVSYINKIKRKWISRNNKIKLNTSINRLRTCNEIKYMPFFGIGYYNCLENFSSNLGK